MSTITLAVCDECKTVEQIPEGYFSTEGWWRDNDWRRSNDGDTCFQCFRKLINSTADEPQAEAPMAPPNINDETEQARTSNDPPSGGYRGPVDVGERFCFICDDPASLVYGSFAYCTDSCWVRARRRGMMHT